MRSRRRGCVSRNNTTSILLGGVPAKFIRYLGDPEEPESQNGTQHNGVTNSESEIKKAEESILGLNDGGNQSPNGYAPPEEPESQNEIQQNRLTNSKSELKKAEKSIL